MKLPNGQNVSWNDEIIVDLIKLYYHSSFHGEAFYAMPTVKTQLSSNQKMIYDEFTTNQPNGILISYPMNGFVFCAPKYGVIILEMPGQKSLKDIVLAIATYYELKPSLIHEFKDFITTVSVQSMQLKMIKKSLISDFLQQFLPDNQENFADEIDPKIQKPPNQKNRPQNSLESPAYCRLVAKLVATQASYSLPFYLPISSKIANAVNNKENHNQQKKVKVSHAVEKSQYGGSTTRHIDNNRSRYPSHHAKSEISRHNSQHTLLQNEKNNHDRTAATSGYGSTATTLKHIKPGQNTQSSQNPEISNKNPKKSDETEEKPNEMAEIVQQVLLSIEHAYPGISTHHELPQNQPLSRQQMYASTIGGSLGKGLIDPNHVNNNLDQFNESLILTPSQHKLRIKCDNLMQSRQAILTGVRGSGKTEMLMMKLARIVKRIQEDRLVTAMVVIGVVRPNLSGNSYSSSLSRQAGFESVETLDDLKRTNSQHDHNSPKSATHYLYSPDLFYKFHQLWRSLGAPNNIAFRTVIASNEIALFREVARKVSISTTEVHLFVEGVTNLERFFAHNSIWANRKDGSSMAGGLDNISNARVIRPRAITNDFASNGKGQKMGARHKIPILTNWACMNNLEYVVNMPEAFHPIEYRMDILLHCPRPIASIYGSLVSYYINPRNGGNTSHRSAHSIMKTQFGVLNGHNSSLQFVKFNVKLKDLDDNEDLIRAMAPNLDIHFTRNLVIDMTGLGAPWHRRFFNDLDSFLQLKSERDAEDRNCSYAQGYTLYNHSFPAWAFCNIFADFNRLSTEKVQDMPWKSVVLILSEEYLMKVNKQAVIKLSEFTACANHSLMIISDFAENDDEFIEFLSRKKANSSKVEAQMEKEDSTIACIKHAELLQDVSKDQLIHAVINGDSQKVLKMIAMDALKAKLTCGISPRKFVNDDYVSVAANVGDAVALQQILKTLENVKGVNYTYDVDDNKILHPIHLAALSGQEKCVELLIEHGHNINQVCYKTLTPIILSALNGNEKLIHHFVDHKTQTRPKGRPQGRRNAQGRRNESYLDEEIDGNDLEDLLEPLLVACRGGNDDRQERAKTSFCSFTF